LHYAKTAEDLILKDTARFTKRFGVPVTISSVHCSEDNSSITSVQTAHIEGENHGTSEERAFSSIKELLEVRSSILLHDSSISETIPFFFLKG